MVIIKINFIFYLVISLLPSCSSRSGPIIGKGWAGRKKPFFNYGQLGSNPKAGQHLTRLLSSWVNKGIQINKGNKGLFWLCYVFWLFSPICVLKNTLCKFLKQKNYNKTQPQPEEHYCIHGSSIFPASRFVEDFAHLFSVLKKQYEQSYVKFL